MEFLGQPVEMPMWIVLVIGINSLIRIGGWLWVGMRQER
jgi:hypothetical protein